MNVLVIACHSIMDNGKYSLLHRLCLDSSWGVGGVGVGSGDLSSGCIANVTRVTPSFGYF